MAYPTAIQADEATRLELVSGSSDITAKNPLQLVPLEIVMDKIRAGKYREKVTKIRDLSARGETEAANKLKKTLSYIVYGIVDGVRKAENVVQANGIILDFDHVAEIEAFKRKAAESIPGARYVFRSPTDGVKVLVPFSAPVADPVAYRQIWELLAEEAENQMGMKPDPTHDMCRACFVSWDKELIKTQNEALDVDFWLSAGQKEQTESTPPTTSFQPPTTSFLRKQEPHLVQGDSCLRRNEEQCGQGDSCLRRNEEQGGQGDSCLRRNEEHYGQGDSCLRRNEEQVGQGDSCLRRNEEQGGRVVDDPSEYYVRLAVEYLCRQRINYHDWTKVCIALYNHLGEAGKEYWNMFLNNPHYPGETQEHLDSMWNSLQRYPAVKIGTLFYIAGNYGWRNVVAPQSEFYSLEDYPELISMFESKKDVPLDRSKLPQIFTEYIDILNQITDSSEGAKLTAFLPVVASCIGNRVAINNAGTRHFCNIWAIIIGPSGISRKSTVINQALKCLELHRKSLAELSPKEKIEQSIELNKPTQARLLNLLSINPNRLIVQTEIGAWMAEMQKSYNHGMKAELTDMFDGNDKTVAKVGIDEYISKPAFSIIGGSTEEWFYRELKETSDQMGGFLQRHIINFYREIDVEKMDFSLRNCHHLDKHLHEYGEMLETFRSLGGTHYLKLNRESAEYRNAIYTAKMRENAMKGSDPLISYTTRIYDNYFFRFCILIFMLKNWMDLQDALEGCEVSSFFNKREVDVETAREAMYLCDYYFENTKPFLADLTEAGKLENEKKIVGLLREYGLEEIPHHRLLSASKLTGLDFRRAIESLVERQAVICFERKGYQNRIARFYRLNPVLV